MQIVVLLRGVLHGMGLTSPCEVLATRTSLRDGGPYKYSDLHILAAPVDWPDGRYHIDLSVISAEVQRDKRSWIIDPPAIPVITPLAANTD